MENKTVKKINIVSSCYNEAGNIREFYERIVKVFEELPAYDYEFIIADNCSSDGTRDILREIASSDKKFKVIMNSNNFGHLRSPYNALLQADGDAVVLMVSDLQDPPELIPELIKKWEEGYDAAIAVRKKTKESLLMASVRSLYYFLLAKLADNKNIIRNFTGFGLYNRRFLNALKKYNEPYPYFRGLVSEIGFKQATVEYVQEIRKHGRSKNNFFTLYDTAMTGFVNHSKLPLRLAAASGFCLAGLSLLIAFGYLIYKLVFWDSFSLGLAPLLIGLFFFSSVQLIFIGIIGEYIGAIYTRVSNKPLAIEDEKLNFNDD